MALKSVQKQASALRFLASEFIGMPLEVVASACIDAHKAKGRITDETTNSFVVETPSKGRKRIPKANTVFRINGFQVDGNSIVGKPEDRTKKFLS